MNFIKTDRKKYIINPKFQNSFFKRLFILFFLISFSSIGFTLYLDMKMSIIFKMFYENEGIDISTKLNQVALMHLIFFIIISLIIFIWGIFVTHKIAGPIYRLKMHFESIFNNLPTVPLHFRKNDEFQDIAESCNKCISSLENRIKNYYNNEKKIITDIEEILLKINDEKVKNELYNLITKIKIN